jgi:hypothetical protein
VLLPQSLLLIKGKIKKNDEDTSIMASSIRKISDASLVSIYFNQAQSFSDLHRLKDLLNMFKGEDPVLLHFPQGKQSEAVLVGSQFWVNPTPEFETNLTRNFAQGLKVSVNRVMV